MFNNDDIETKKFDYLLRREYLHDNILEPPIDYKNKHQAKKEITKKDSFDYDSDDSSDSVEDKTPVVKPVLEKRQTMIKPTKKTRTRTTKERQSRAEDWKYESQAGCKFWVNHITGEVLSRNPFDTQNIVGDDSYREAVTIYDHKEEEEQGTGALAYDSSDINELLQELELDNTNEEK